MNAETLIVALMAFGSRFFKACFLDYAILHDQVHRIDLTRFALRCVEELGIAAKYRDRNSAWKKGCDTLTGVGLHENWTLDK